MGKDKKLAELLHKEIANQKLQTYDSLSLSAHIVDTLFDSVNHKITKLEMDKQSHPYSCQDCLEIASNIYFLHKSTQDRRSDDQYVYDEEEAVSKTSFLTLYFNKVGMNYVKLNMISCTAIFNIIAIYLP